MEKKGVLGQTAGLKDIINNGQRKRDKKKPGVNDEMTRLLIDDFFDIKKIKFGPNVCKDSKKLEKLLSDMAKAINTIVKCCQQQTRLTATELVGRPTYVEEFNNIRDNINLAIKPKEEENVVIDEDWDNISHYSKVSIRRATTYR